MFEERKNFPLPILVRSFSSSGSTYAPDVFDATLQNLLPDLTERELGKINDHFFELLDKIAQKSGHLPKDFVPTVGKGEMTHVLNGRLLRRDGIWIPLHFTDNPMLFPIEILSINRRNKSNW